jgi:hypothetical protein
MYKISINETKTKHMRSGEFAPNLDESNFHPTTPENPNDTTVRKIKILKKGETREQPTPPPIDTEKAQRLENRNTTATVESWVTDFQNRQAEETTQATDKFFGNQNKNEGH